MPEITVVFWSIKGLSTALGESVSDYLVHAMSPVAAVGLGFVGFIVALALQFSMGRYVAWTYWFAVAMVGVFGTMLGILGGYLRGVARIVRAEFMSVRTREFVQAAILVGESDIRIMLTQVLPNALSPVIVAGSLLVATAILLESALSFLGLGVQPPDASLGSLLRQGSAYLTFAPWLALTAGAVLSAAIMSVIGAMILLWLYRVLIAKRR